MVIKKERLVFHMITSKIFWVGAPILIEEIVKRGYYISVFDEQTLPSCKKLLDCDVFIDMSAITKKTFYSRLERECKIRRKLLIKTPLMVDPPKSIVNSFDKRKTHKMFIDIIPESYNLTGKNNGKKINKFKGEKFVVLKDPVGWGGKSVEKKTLDFVSQNATNYKISFKFLLQHNC